MAEPVVSVALETLGNLLIEEAGFLKGVRGQVEGLKTELGNLQSLLKDADRKQHDSETIRNWIKQIRLLAHRAEDVLEEYVVKVGSRNGEGFLNILKRFVCFANEMGTLHNLGSEIESIKSKITDLAAKMNNSGIQAIISPAQEETSDENKRRLMRQTYPHKELQHFVGMEHDIEKLVSLLVSDEESGHGVIGVWGMGGSGKTTVASKVYKHAQVRGFFESFAWVCITQKCQIQSVIQDIFRQLLPNVGTETSDHALVEQIHEVQMEQKCLVVVDDIWKLDDWECLNNCLPNHGSHSKILLTTRNRNVAETAGRAIQLKGFTEDEAWELLRLKAFPKFKEPGDYSEYENLGRTMIRKCDRLPLAIAVLGGILSGKNSLHEWKTASDDVNSYIGRGKGPGATGEVEKVLGLSYDELPHHLKPCFLSLGFAQEDHRIDVESVYNLWTAQGFIQPKDVCNGETMDDVAKSYLYELQFRSMVQFDDVSLLSLHDSMLEMCRSKAKEEEFLKVVGNGNVSEKAYRLVVHVGGEDSDLEVLKEVENTIPLRSLQIIPTHSLNENLLLNLPKNTFNLRQYKSLRFLIVHSCNLRGRCFQGIENLIHLRSLCLITCRWENFSLESVYKLSFLNTLILTGTTILEIPPVDAFCKMPRLRYLALPMFRDEVRIQRKLRLMNLRQLEILYNFHSEFYDVRDINHLSKLRTLHHCWLNDDQSLAQITDYMCGSCSNLRWMDIFIAYCDLDGSDALRKLLTIPTVTLQLSINSCKLSALPRLEAVDLSQLCPGLVELELNNIPDIAEDIMQTIGKFPNLKKLNVQGIRFCGEEMVCDAGSFPRLEQVCLYFVRGEFELRIDEAAMLNLSWMQIVECSGIAFAIPDRLKPLVRILLAL